MPTYRLSTIRGMSSPLLMNGKVVGIILILLPDIRIGVHMDMNSMSANSCIAFAWDEVRGPLEDHGIIGIRFHSAYRNN